jgi:hypothetical protein
MYPTPAASADDAVSAYPVDPAASLTLDDPLWAIISPFVVVGLSDEFGILFNPI